jgi:hypothetical protein
VYARIDGHNRSGHHNGTVHYRSDDYDPAAKVDDRFDSVANVDDGTNDDDNDAG